MVRKTNLIFLIPIVTVYVIAVEIFDVSPLVASIMGLLTIPITSLFSPVRTDAQDGGNNVVTEVADASVDSLPTSSTKQTFNKAENIATVISIGTIIFIVILVALNSPDGPRPMPQTDTKLRQISHPDFFSNPSAFTIDFDNKIDSELVAGQPLWVEKISYSSDMYYLTVTYVRTMYNGEDIIEMANILLPNLKFANGNDDVQACVAKKLNEVLLKKYITIDLSASTPILKAGSEDLVSTLVESGYGDPTNNLSSIYYNHRPCISSESGCPYMSNVSQKGSLSVADFNNLAARPRETLTEAYQLAELKGIGMHGECH